MSEEVQVSTIPRCDLCGDGTPAKYDGRMHTGSWANMCEQHFATYGVGLGTGRGQRLVLTKEEV